MTYLANPQKLPEWFSLCTSVEGSKVSLVDSKGLLVKAHLEIIHTSQLGVCDYHFVFSDGTDTTIETRTRDLLDGSCLIQVLFVNPCPEFEKISGDFSNQAHLLSLSLRKLKQTVESTNPSSF